MITPKELYEWCKVPYTEFENHPNLKVPSGWSRIPRRWAGAGDAHLAGIIVGLAEGMEFSRAHKLGTVVAGLSVTSPHTINKSITRKLVWSVFEQLA
ncbi:MAG: PfkB family carbohydrate kinase [Armatimonadota bacterium]